MLRRLALGTPSCSPPAPAINMHVHKPGHAAHMRRERRKLMEITGVMAVCLIELVLTAGVHDRKGQAQERR